MPWCPNLPPRQANYYFTFSAPKSSNRSRKLVRTCLLAFLLLSFNCRDAENQTTSIMLDTFSLELENGGFLGSDGQGYSAFQVTASVKKKALSRKDTVFQGPYEAYLEYGCGENEKNRSAVKVSGNFKDGKKHGKWMNTFYGCERTVDTSTYETKIVGSYDSGKRTGDWIISRLGQPVETQHYTNGNLDSTSVTRTVSLEQETFSQTAIDSTGGLDIQLFLSKLPSGATVKDVVKLLGTPHRTKHEGKKITWYYNRRYHDGNRKCSRYVVLFYDARFMGVECNENGKY